jgi:hypothetical protein
MITAFILARPYESNLWETHFSMALLSKASDVLIALSVVRGPPDSPYAGVCSAQPVCTDTDAYSLAGRVCRVLERRNRPLTTNGRYHGTLTFTDQYPFAPPAVRMVTPSGRFKTGTLVSHAKDRHGCFRSHQDLLLDERLSPTGAFLDVSTQLD